MLRRHGGLVLADLDRAGLLTEVTDADVLWVRLRHLIDAHVLAVAPRLKLIVTPTTGLNHIDLHEAQRRRIKVLSLRGETEFLSEIRATAEHTVGLMLALLRYVPAAAAAVRKGHWDRELFKGHELFGKTIGIIGYGRLGRVIARYLKAFEARILTTDPTVSPQSVEPGVILTSLNDLLIASDIVTLHVTFCQETRGFFGATQFSQMKRGSWFINTSRGELVVERALLDALHSGQLAGAAVDVLCDEQSGNTAHNPLVVYAREQDNLIITPHIGGCTFESMEKTETFLAKKLSEGPLHMIVD